MAGNSKAEARKRFMDLIAKKSVQPETGVGGGNTPVVNAANARQGQVGALRGDTHVTIQTHQAQVLLTGREATAGRPRIIGLMQFSTYLSQISVAAKQDDPWADWMLVQVEERLEEAENKLAGQQANLDRVLAANPLMDIQVSESIKPLKVSIGFASSHAYWVARVILQYDAVVRAVLTARHHALIDQQLGSLLMDDAAKLIRRVFETTARYRVAGLTRADVQAGGERVAEAVQKMGTVPADILDGSRRAKFAPAIQNTAPEEGEPQKLTEDETDVEAV